MTTLSLREYIDSLLQSMQFEMQRIEYCVEEDKAPAWNRVHSEYLELCDVIRGFDKLASHREMGAIARAIAPVLVANMLNKAEAVVTPPPISDYSVKVGLFEYLQKALVEQNHEYDHFRSRLDGRFDRITSRLNALESGEFLQVTTSQIEGLSKGVKQSDARIATHSTKIKKLESSLSELQDTVKEVRLKTNEHTDMINRLAVAVEKADQANPLARLNALEERLERFIATPPPKPSIPKDPQVAVNKTNIGDLISRVALLNEETNLQSSLLKRLIDKVNSMPQSIPDPKPDYATQELVRTLKDELGTTQVKVRALEAAIDAQTKSINQLIEAYEKL